MSSNLTEGTTSLALRGDVLLVEVTHCNPRVAKIKRECKQIAGLALMAERLVEAEGVGGSSPSASTKISLM